MKASQNGQVRPTLLFSQTPHSVARRAKRLPNRTAAELLRYLCELTIGFGRGFIELTYRALAEALHKDWRTIARAAKLLFSAGDVEVDALRDGSYRWYVLLEPEDVVKDPRGVYRLKVTGPERTDTPHDKSVMGSWQERHGGHDKDVIGGMTSLSWGQAPDQEQAKPMFTGDEAALDKAENEALKIPLKDTDLKIHHQSGDESSVNHKKLLGELLALGTSQRVARQLLRENDHDLVARCLEKALQRADLMNPAAYLIREVKDGGYQNIVEPVKPSAKVSRETTSGVPTTPPTASVGVEQTKAELAALEAERAREEMASRHNAKILLQRFQGLAEDLKLELKARWTKHLDSMIPNTPKKAKLLQEQTFQRIAFKEVTAKFFGLIDEGVSTDHALARLAA